MIYLATLLSNQLFSNSTSKDSILYSMGLFAISIIARPFGGILFGCIEDRYGRVISVKLSTGLMALPILGMAFLP